MKPLVDRDDRRRAVTDFDTNLVVVAGAGTGKTSLLVERILNACLGEGIRLESMAAITFTEKAAAEMRDRLSGALEQVVGLATGAAPADIEAGREAVDSWEYLNTVKKIGPDEIARRGRQALVDLDEAIVGTIHSLCADLLRRYPRESGVDPAFQVDEGTARRRLAEECWQEWLRDEFRGDAGSPALWREILERVSPVQLAETGRTLAEAPPPAGGSDRDDAAGWAALRRRCAEVIAELDAAGKKHPDINDKYRQHLQACREILRAVEKNRPIDPGRTPFPIKGTPSPGREFKGAIRTELDNLGKGARSFSELCLQLDPVADRVMELLRPYARRFRARFAEEGFVSFEDLLVGARDLLRDRREVREREKNRFRLILVDEFQDTSPLQYEIAFYLGEARDAGGGDDNDSFAPPLQPGKLFIVGDPKQSIYRFRGADIEAYGEAVKRIEAAGGVRLHLRSNFRSPPEILDPLNRLFESCFAAHPATQAEYEPVDSALPAATEPPCVEIWTVPPQEEKEPIEIVRRREGRVIAAWIGESVERKSIRYRDVAILFRAMSSVDLYLRALRESRIPFVVEGGRVFGKKPEVQEFLSLLRLLLNPHDPVALLSVLRSPLGGVTDVELARHAGAGGAWHLYARVDAKSCPDICRTLEELRQLREQIRFLPPDRAIRQVLDSRHLRELHAAAYEGSQRVANLLRLVDRLGGRSREERLSLEETLRILEREFGRDEVPDHESPLADEALDAVRVLTVHKAKGLEFPVVLIPDLGRRPNSSASTSFAAKWVGLGRGRSSIALRLGDGDRKALNPAAVVHGERVQEHDRAERIRALYVACTRARERLILVNGTAQSAPWLQLMQGWDYRWHKGTPPGPGPLAGGAVNHSHRPPPARPKPADRRPFPIEPVVASVKRFQEARAGAAAAAVRWIRSPSGLHEAMEQPGETDDAIRVATADRPRNLGAAAGIGVHWLLQVWDRNDPAWFRDHAGEAAAAGALDTGVDRDEVRAAIDAILDPFLASELPKRLQEIELVGREIPFEAADGDTLLRGWIDLVYRRAGAWVVADFKTDRVDSGGEAALLETYQPQLSAYARALRRVLDLDGDPAREIWSIRTGRILAYPASG